MESAWAQARHVDSPPSSPSILFVILGPPVNHLSVVVSLVGVDGVVPELLRLSDVDVRPLEDEDPDYEVSVAEGMVGCSWLGE